MGCKQIDSASKKKLHEKLNPSSHLNTENENLEKELNEELDFESYKEEIKNNERIYQIKIPLYEIKNKNKTLISKYFFFTNNGEFTSKIKNNQNNEIIFIKGKIGNEGDFEFKRISEGNEKEFYSYKGRIDSIEKSSSPIEIKGKVYFIGDELPNTEFILELPKCIWNIKYEEKNQIKKDFSIFMYFEEDIFKGISYDCIDGVSFWFGIEKNEKNDKIIQQYITKKNGESKCLIFTGNSNKINGFKIEGSMNNNALGIKSEFIMKMIYKKKE